MIDRAELLALAEEAGVNPNGLTVSRAHPSRGAPWIHETWQAWRSYPRLVPQVAAARRFLRGLPRRQTLNRSFTTYTLKHYAERWRGRYICNGSMILACLLEGVQLNRPPDSPNPVTNLAAMSRWPADRTRQRSYLRAADPPPMVLARRSNVVPFARPPA